MMMPDDGNDNENDNDNDNDHDNNNNHEDDDLYASAGTLIRKTFFFRSAPEEGPR